MANLQNHPNEFTFGKDVKAHAVILMPFLTAVPCFQIESDLMCGKLFMISVSRIKENTIQRCGDGGGGDVRSVRFAKCRPESNVYRCLSGRLVGRC